MAEKEFACTLCNLFPVSRPFNMSNGPDFGLRLEAAGEDEDAAVAGAGWPAGDAARCGGQPGLQGRVYVYGTGFWICLCTRRWIQAASR